MPVGFKSNVSGVERNKGASMKETHRHSRNEIASNGQCEGAWDGSRHFSLTRNLSPTFGCSQGTALSLTLAI